MSSVESELKLQSIDKEYANVAIIDLKDSLKQQTQKTSPFHKGTCEMVDTARRAFNAGRTKSVQFRKQQLQNLLRLVQENSEDFVEALKNDLGRHAMESSVFDINLCIHEVTRIIWNLNDWVKPEYPSKPFANILDKLSIRNEAYGVVLVIGSWNFPVNLLLGPIAGAIAAGNCVVMKPSEVSVATEQVIAKLIPKYLDRECYHVYTGGPEESAKLLQQRFDYIFFTGSTSVGKLVHAAANKYLTPVTLELGGKNPTYLDNTVNMERAAQRILYGKCSNAGQICISPDYLLCTREVQEQFVAAAKKVLNDWYNNDAKSSSYYCKIISDKHCQRLVNFIKDKSDIALGGRYDLKERYIEPTILTDVAFGDAIMQEEIFGPILPIVTVDNVQEAIEVINAHEKPLVIYIFTNDKGTKDLILNECNGGGVLVNDTLTHFIVESLPFGGVGFSGMGRYHGKSTFDTFVHKRSVLEKGYSFILEAGMRFRYPPYTNFKMAVINQLTKPRKGISSATLKTLITFTSGSIFVIILQLIYYLITSK